MLSFVSFEHTLLIPPLVLCPGAPFGKRSGDISNLRYEIRKRICILCDLIADSYDLRQHKRVLLTRFAFAFILLNVVHCLAQGILLAFLFTTDRAASDLVAKVLTAADVPRTNIVWHHRDHGRDSLQLCREIPWENPDENCITLFDVNSGTSGNWTAPLPFRQEVGDVDLVIQPSTNATGHVNGVFVTSENGSGRTFLDEQCTRTLLYPSQVLNNSKKEVIVLLVAQFWLLGVSLYSILFGSVPHLLVVYCIRLLLVGWSAYTIWRTKDIQTRFLHLISGPDTPCRFDFFPTYFQTRIALQIPELVLAFTACAFSGYLGWHLMKTFQAQTFKHVGPPESIIHIYHRLLAISGCFHLSVFLILTTVGLWADQLLNGALAAISEKKNLYNAVWLFTVLTLIPWSCLGSRSVREERRGMMALALVLGAIYIVAWMLMFCSRVYRWTWVQWPFFACTSIASLLLLIACCVLGFICWFNFGKGLAQYLRAENALADANFEPEMFSHELSSESGHGHGTRESAFGASYAMRVDTNWDFADIKRPPIYMVDMHTDDKFRTIS
ncbi:hypothetical protein K474DRAFT_1729343 [Panus rudis PR-1116 ss-1]|nr:hypothetical protein K474DRAFT_1729343 [Panus rudis PR-1116 ss-1]